MQVEADVGNRQAEAVFFTGQGSRDCLPRQYLAEKSEGCPVVVVHHFATQAPSPCPFRGYHLFAEGDGQRANRLDGESAREITPGIGFIKLFGQCVCRGALYIRTGGSNGRAPRCRLAPSGIGRAFHWSWPDRFRSRDTPN